MKLSDYLEILQIARSNFSDWIFIAIFIFFSYIIIKKHKGKVVAFASHSFGRLHYFAVDKSFRNRRIGTKLLKRIKNKIKFLNVRPNNLKAIRMYERGGFKKVGTITTLTGKRLRMER